MPTPILMPALSPTMEEGKLAKWLVREGDKVTAGTVIAEIETDKATMEIEAIDDGTIGRIVVPEGTEKVKVNMPIAILLGEGESAATLPPGTAPAAAPAPMPPPQQAARQPQQQASATRLAAPLAVPAAPRPAPADAQPLPARTGPNGQSAERIVASPLARRLAREAGLDLTALTGSGPRGRIVKSDIERAKAQGPRVSPVPAGAQQGQAVATTGPQGPAIAPMPEERILALYDKAAYEVVPHDAMRRIIAQRLTLSKQTIPHFYMTVDCRLDALLAARERLNGAAPKDGPRAYKLSVNDFLIKALALALQQVPAANATWTDSGMLRHKYSDVGVAVAVQGGLFTPIVKHAEVKTLSEISNEMKDLAERARKRRLAPHEYQGGSSSISNLGMYGIKAFDAVINPPHATILAVGAGEKRAVVAGDRVEVATMMSCTLSCDHRVVDGALGAEMLNAFKAFVEDPVRMLV